MRKTAILAALVAFALAHLSARVLRAQAAPGTFSDANHPSGPPDPEKLDSIWQVDPITDQVSINVPFTTTPQGGRGPKVPFSLLYNSASTVTLQAKGAYSAGSGAQVSAFQWSAYPIATPIVAPSGPWTTTGPYFYGSYTAVSNVTEPPPDPDVYVGCTISGPYVYVDQDGSSHDMNLLDFTSSYSNPQPPDYWQPSCGSASGSTNSTYWSSSVTADGSTLATSNGTATGPDGTIVSMSALTDANGNRTSITYSNGATTVTDALGRIVYTTNIPIGLPGQIPAGTYTLTTYSATDAAENYTIVFSNETLGTFPEYGNTGMAMPHPNPADNEIGSPTFCLGSSCSGEYGVGQPGPGADQGTFTAVTEIDLPDGQSAYTFSYDPVYGTISKITFPTGGYVRFVWGIRDKDWNPYGQFTAISAIVVTDAYVSPTGSSHNENHWGYTPQNSETPASLSTSSTPIGYVYAPDGSYTYYTGQCNFDYTLVPFFNIGPRYSCKETSHVNYSGSAAILASEIEQYTSQGLTQQVNSTLYGSSSPTQKETAYYYDGYNNVIEEDESDFYSCSSSPCPVTAVPSGKWLRKTYTTFAPSSAFTPAHIVDKPSQVVVTDGGGTAYSLVNYTYNSYGNATNESKCISISGAYPHESCSAFWQTQYTPDSHGQITQKVEGYGTGAAATTNYTWTGPSGSSDSYNGYLTTIAYPNGASDQYKYSAYTGEVETHVDWNNNTTTYAYADSLNRITSITLPATVDGTTGSNGSGTTTYTYNDSAGNFSVEEQQKINLLPVSTQTTTYFDGLGRKITTKAVTPECSSPVEVDTVYDSMSRVYTVSNPYCATSDPTYGLTTFAYDGLSRKIQTTTPDNAVSTIQYADNAIEFTDPTNGTVTPQHIQQVDGLGRLVNVCEISSSKFGNVTPAQCSNLNISGSGYLTTYTYNPLGDLLSASQQGGVSRSFTYDPLNRLTQAVNAETGSVTYVYSSPSAFCSPDPAVPCSKTDARGVRVTYGYDNMSRVLSKTYSDGATPIACYQYDSSSVTGAGTGNGPTGGNLMGHLTNAWTQSASSGSCTSPPSTFITLKSFLKYDPVGRPYSSRQQSCVAGNCTVSTAPQSYQFGMSYDLAGNMTTLTNPVGANNNPLTLTNYFNSASRACLTTSSWTTMASPNIFQENPAASSTSPGYSLAGGLQNFYLGSTASNASTSCSSTPASPVNVVLNYTKRFWVSGISATGQIP